MFLPGVKIGPRPGWLETLNKTNAKYCEIWFSIDDPIEKYNDIFLQIKERSIHAGLHFWGLLDGSIMPNIGYPDEHIWKPSLERIKQTILLAAKHQFEYVNIHVGNAGLEKMQIEPDGIYTNHIEGSEVSCTSTQETFKRNVLILHEFSQEKHVNLIIETVPPMDPSFGRDIKGRLNPHKTYALSNLYLEQLAKEHNLFINNDISHTVSEFPETTDRTKLWLYLLDRTTAMLPYTKLVHMNTVCEPFNGTDSHDGILETDFDKNVFPNKQQVLTLLSLFEKQQNIWVINEPNEKFIENYNQLVSLQKQIHG